MHPSPAWISLGSLGAEGEGLLVTRWLTVSSAYKFWQSIMVSHRAVDQLIELWLISTALWDVIMHCQDSFAELKINHLVTRRAWPTGIMDSAIFGTLGGKQLSSRVFTIKGTTRVLSGVFLPLVMKPLCPLKYYDRSITSQYYYYYTLFLEGIVHLAP